MNQADEPFDDTFTATAAPNSHDLSGGLTRALGGNLVLVKLKTLLVVNLSLVAGEVLKIGNDTNHVPIFGATADFYPIGPGGFFFTHDPSLAAIAVTAGTGDIIKLDPGSATIKYELYLIGTSA